MSNLAIPKVHQRAYLAPVPGLRLWAWMLSRWGFSTTHTTPGMLYDALKADGLTISKRSLSSALSGLHRAGMISVERHGNALTIRVEVDNAAA